MPFCGRTAGRTGKLAEYLFSGFGPGNQILHRNRPQQVPVPKEHQKKFFSKNPLINRQRITCQPNTWSVPRNISRHRFPNIPRNISGTWHYLVSGDTTYSSLEALGHKTGERYLVQFVLIRVCPNVLAVSQNLLVLEISKYRHWIRQPRKPILGVKAVSSLVKAVHMGNLHFFGL